MCTGRPGWQTISPQNMSYKFVELLSCNFARSPDELVRQQITYRYNALKVPGRGAGAPASLVGEAALAGAFLVLRVGGTSVSSVSWSRS